MTAYRRTCGQCGGKGWVRSSTFGARQTCTVCKGSGYVELSNVVIAPVVTTLEGRPDDVLKHAIGELESVVVIGYTKGGEEYYASSIADGPNALWLLKRMAHNLLSIVDRED